MMADCCPSVTLCVSLQVWSLEQPDWHCKIDEGSIGLVSSRWSPDGRHILNTTEFHVSVKLVRACIHAHGSVFMRMLVWFQLLLARKEGGPENSQTPEPFLTARTPPSPPAPPDACIQPDFIAPLLLASCHTWVSSTSGTWVQCVCVLPRAGLVFSLTASPINDVLLLK